jgi:hypothetical protein
LCEQVPTKSATVEKTASSPEIANLQEPAEPELNALPVAQTAAPTPAEIETDDDDEVEAVAPAPG